ncbi:hypothetical protein ATCC90586_000554 [Pythium insidiosum]|nr:hypothetical protein ATCC90586_000554 [Pythium insidiosum]
MPPPTTTAGPLRTASNQTMTRHQHQQQQRRTRRVDDGASPDDSTSSASGGRDRQERRRRRRRRQRQQVHRAYGLPNANQILLSIAVVALLFLQLLLPKWIELPDADATAGLYGFDVQTANDTSTRISWDDFCDARRYNFSLPVDDAATELETPLPLPAAEQLCRDGTRELVRGLTATSIALALLSLTVAIYLHLGDPTQRVIVWLGAVPSIALLATGAIGTAVVTVWQQQFGALDNGDTYSVAVAATVIAYLVAVSMIIRWRWPGIFAVANEQQAVDARRTRYYRAPRAVANNETPTPNVASTPETPPPPRSGFHAIV